MRTVWLVLTVAAALAEGYALLRPKSGDTLSEQAWALLARWRWLRWPALLFWTWLTFHLFFTHRAG